MAFALDPQVAEALAPVAEAMKDVIPPPPGDVDARRPALDAMLEQSNNAAPFPTDVTFTDHELISGDGTTFLARWYARTGSAPGPAVVYFHGGGMIAGSVATHHGTVARYVSASGVPMLSVQYRLAPEHPHPAPAQDAYASLQWLADHAAELGVDSSRIAVMGDSAGGGLAAAVALIARDQGGPAIAAQILVYPMLDDRNTTPDAEIAPFAVWTYDDNITGWGALLGDRAGAGDVPADAAPARGHDAAALPPAYIEVGQLDIFRDEDLAYAGLLSRAGVPVEFHLRPGVRTSSTRRLRTRTCPGVPFRTGSGCCGRSDQ
jgi:acetyl esterase/lipase